MADGFAAALASALGSVRLFPLWLLLGLCAAGTAMLLAPGQYPEQLRLSLGGYIWGGTILAGCLSVTRIAHLVHAMLQERKLLRPLRFVPTHNQSYWGLAKQRDGRTMSQVRLEMEVTNVGDDTRRISHCRVARLGRSAPAESGNFLLPSPDSDTFERYVAIPGNTLTIGHFHAMVPGRLGKPGRPTRVALEFSDNLGVRYLVRGLELPFLGKVETAPAWYLRTGDALKRILQPELPSAQPEAWQHGGRWESVDLILTEEQRAYAARGRSHGKLGTLNTGVQSQPGGGGTITGAIPSLLWPAEKSRDVGSPNADRLVVIYRGLTIADRPELEAYLLSHLDRTSRFSDVAYLIILTLYRVGRVVDGLSAARVRLAGDQKFGFSNVLATVSALVSYEHFKMSEATLAGILDEVEGTQEPNFSLKEKITAARVERIGKRRPRRAAAAKPKAPNESKTD